MRSQSKDMKRRSKEGWERGRGARKIGNPRYKPKRIRGKDDVVRKIYCLRARKKKNNYGKPQQYKR